MDEQELLRYSRHVLLDEIDAEGQARLAGASVLLVGLGGLGSAAAGYLCASGLGRLVLVDDDTVDLSNLQRQLLHGTADIGRLKTESARASLEELNPLVTIETRNARADEQLTARLARNVDVVLDCSDNFETRYAVNAACVKTGTPLISGSAIRWSGNVLVFPLHEAGPCYACVFPPDTAAPPESCGESGVLAPLVGVIGSLQAVEAIKLLIGRATEPVLYRYDALNGAWRRARLERDPDCRVCATAQ